MDPHCDNNKDPRDEGTDNRNNSDIMCDPASPVMCDAMCDLATGRGQDQDQLDGQGNSGPIHPHCQTQCFTCKFKTSNGKLIGIFVIFVIGSLSLKRMLYKIVVRFSVWNQPLECCTNLTKQ